MVLMVVCDGLTLSADCGGIGRWLLVCSMVAPKLVEFFSGSMGLSLSVEVVRQESVEVWPPSTSVEVMVTAIFWFSLSAIVF